MSESSSGDLIFNLLDISYDFFKKNPETTGLFDKVVEILFHPGNILFIMDLEGGDRVGDIVPCNYTGSHSFMERVCC